jgi:hypothetical protein
MLKMLIMIILKKKSKHVSVGFVVADAVFPIEPSTETVLWESLEGKEISIAGMVSLYEGSRRSKLTIKLPLKQGILKTSNEINRHGCAFGAINMSKNELPNVAKFVCGLKKVHDKHGNRSLLRH